MLSTKVSFNLFEPPIGSKIKVSMYNNTFVGKYTGKYYNYGCLVYNILPVMAGFNGCETVNFYSHREWELADEG